MLVGYGIAVALIGAARWDHQLPTRTVAIESGRQQDISEAINVLDQGGPPLIAAQGSYSAAVRDGSVVPADRTDDPGIYLYLPVASHLLGDADPQSLLKWFFIGCMSLVLLAYPIVFYLLFDSLLIGLAAPLVVLFESGSLVNTDLYFIQAWVVLLLLPVVLVVAKRPWRRSASRSSPASRSARALPTRFAAMPERASRSPRSPSPPGGGPARGGDSARLRSWSRPTS